MRRIHLLAAKRLVGASVVGVGAYALRRTSRAHCENSAAASPPLDASSSAAVAKAAANGDLTAQNLDMNIARVEDWKAAIESAKQAWASDRRTEAETLLRAALDKAAYFGAESPPVATSLHNLAELLKRTARPKEAAPLYERALQIFEKTAGPAHRTTTTCLLALAGLRDEAGERAAARALYARAADALRAAALEEPKKSPGLAAVLVRLGACILRSRAQLPANCAACHALMARALLPRAHPRSLAPPARPPPSQARRRAQRARTPMRSRPSPRPCASAARVGATARRASRCLGSCSPRRFSETATARAPRPRRSPRSPWRPPRLSARAPSACSRGAAAEG